MKVLDLRCDNGHGFEGWFGSEDDYAGQSGRGEIACPLCASIAVVRLPSAPRLSLGRSAEPAKADAAPGAAADAAPTDGARPPPVPAPSAGAAMAMTMQSQWLRAVRQVMAQTEDVGPRFAEEARKIHYGEAEERGIRGQASASEAAALHAEGIEVMTLPVPEALKGPLQ